jgi:hypothetical protein
MKKIIGRKVIKFGQKINEDNKDEKSPAWSSGIVSACQRGNEETGAVSRETESRQGLR